MDDRFIISDFYQEYLLGFLMHQDRLERVYDFHAKSVVGNIYCGYVKDVVKNIHAAFVEFDKDKKGYFPIGMEKTLCQGDRVLVQVSGDTIKEKDYTLTKQITLNSECLILTVGNPKIQLSRKITDKKQRDTLKNLLTAYGSPEYGFIIRTNAVRYSEEKIKMQAASLIAQWENIQRAFAHAAAGSVLFRKNHMAAAAREFLEKRGGRILTDNEQTYQTLQAEGIEAMWHDDSKISLCNLYSLGKYLKEALEEKVWLKSGAYLVIQPTEALTVIDVNTGKAQLRTKRQETIQRINIEAALEAARQIQLRNLSGIILVDFINMEDKNAYAALEQRMKEAVDGDYLPCCIHGFTKLGLMEITRKKQEKPLYEMIKKESYEKN